jgi:hypothetical protein
LIKIWLLKISKKHLNLALLIFNIGFWLYIASTHPKKRKRKKAGGYSLSRAET